jgi:hypothetical protein
VCRCVTVYTLASGFDPYVVLLLAGLNQKGTASEWSRCITVTQDFVKIGQLIQKLKGVTIFI